LEFPPVSVDANRPVHRYSSIILALLVVFIVVIAGSACTRNNSSLTAPRAALKMSQQDRASPEHGTLSREHSVVIDVPETELETRFRRVADRCTGDLAHHCTILQSDLSSGQSPSGLIKLRIDPGAVEDLVTFVSGLGKLEHRSTTVEDLADSIQDTQSRVEMLTNYRKQLLELQAKAATNIDAAIRIASELSTVQSNLEHAAGKLHIKRSVLLPIS
jgi:Domain of unknown function (DUF4349)